jgi:hypothetical protein
MLHQTANKVIGDAGIQHRSRRIRNNINVICAFAYIHFFTKPTQDASCVGMTRVRNNFYCIFDLRLDIPWDFEKVPDKDN